MKYCIGVDFGTQSGRAVVVETGTGDIVAQAVRNYPHGVMDEFLPDGKTKLGADWALQHPADYIGVLETAVPEALAASGANPRDIIGVGIDFTACTLVATDSAGVPLCFHDEHKGNPHSYIKLWKHHAAQKQANRLNATAKAMGEDFLARYGGKISSEWMLPKIMQMLEEDPALFKRTGRFMEAADWVVMWLTGNEMRNSCTAGYKALWHKKKGYPSKKFLKALSPGLENLVEEKLSDKIYPLGTRAGGLTAAAAKAMGLLEGTAVAVANVDAHVSVPAVGITGEGQMLMIMGTSTCHMVLGTEERIVPGMCGVVEDGIMPGYLGYEAGQSCVGDHFEWFVENCVPGEYFREAADRGLPIHDLLVEKASAQKPGESGLLALDWWNGNRSVLVDADLTGMVIGCTLLTRPEEIYRALIEATAYGTRMIVEAFRDNGVPVDSLFAAGGIAEKNPFMMQIYSDVTGMEIRIAKSSQSAALGSAMFGAVAAGAEKGGYNTIFEAAKEMGGVRDSVYRPDPVRVEEYNLLYGEYRILHDYFGRGGNDVMKRLKEIKSRQGRK
ncbi:MAG: ribulokinase [Clostridia bacterium]|nr:ribulokinase [Clostridia bacterium]